MTSPVSKVPQVRLLPSLMVCAGALLALKLIGIGIGVDAFLSGVQPAYAQADAEPDHGGDEAAAAHESDGETAEHGTAEAESAAVAEVDPSARLTPEQFDRPSSSEQDVLRALSQRRKELDMRERDIQMQGRLLEASERRVQARIVELKEIEGRIETLFGVQEEAQEEQLMSLVTMYSNMKPKDAARILGQLDMDVLIQVVRRMSERKMSPILAAMDPVAAQELTVELATGGSIHPDLDMTSMLDEAPAAR
jgi:flagellar motility protein MotE (MotC chaperone)